MAKADFMTVSDQTFTAKLARDHKRATDSRRKWRYGETTTKSSGDKIKPARQHPHDGRMTWDFLGQRDRYGLNPGKWDMDEIEVKTRRDGYWSHDPNCTFPESQVVDSVYWELYDGPYGELTYSEYMNGGFPRAQDLPVAGEHVLGAAVDKAVARFENKVTETLVKNEYDLVTDAASAAGDVQEREVEDEDFELV